MEGTRRNPHGFIAVPLSDMVGAGCELYLQLKDLHMQKASEFINWSKFHTFQSAIKWQCGFIKTETQVAAKKVLVILLKTLQDFEI